MNLLPFKETIKIDIGLIKCNMRSNIVTKMIGNIDMKIAVAIPDKTRGTIEMIEIIEIIEITEIIEIAIDMIETVMVAVVVEKIAK